jgi:hypothetical protein
MGLHGYPDNRILFCAGFLTYHGDDRVVFTLSGKHRALLNRLWEDPELSGQVGALLMESSDVNQYYLGHRLMKISERGKK